MALKIRMSRGGRKGAPFYRIVVADSRSPRDGAFIERLGSYDPRLPQGHEARVVLNAERIQHWLGVGAQPSERIALMLGQAGIAPMPAQPNRPKKSAPKAKAQERIREQEAAAEAKREAEEAAKAEAAAAAEAAKAEAEAAKAAPAEEAVAEEAPAEEAAAEEAAAEEAPAEDAQA